VREEGLLGGLRLTLSRKEAIPGSIAIVVPSGGGVIDKLR
jgi:hypothetical protein